MKKTMLREIMLQAWQFVKRNGYTMSNALHTAWLNAKVHAKMQIGICKFYFQKIDGTMREAYGTIRNGLVPAITNNRKSNDSVQVYYDTEKQDWRCYKKANLVKVELL